LLYPLDWDYGGSQDDGDYESYLEVLQGNAEEKLESRSNNTIDHVPSIASGCFIPKEPMDEMESKY
jgi:hypothetical protein